MATYVQALAEAAKRSSTCASTFVVVFEASDSRHARDSYRCALKGSFGLPAKTAGEAVAGVVTHQIENHH